MIMFLWVSLGITPWCSGSKWLNNERFFPFPQKLGTSTFVCYLMPNPFFIYKQFFHIIKFSINTEFIWQKLFYFKQFSFPKKNSLLLLNSLIKPYQVLLLRDRVGVGMMATKRYSAFEYNWNLTIRLFICGGARGAVVIVVGNGHGDTSSNPGTDWLHFT